MPVACERCGLPVKRSGRRFCSRSCAGYAQQPERRPIEERFWEKVIRLEGGCWRWTGAKNRKGYGSISLERHRPVLAHRVSWELHRGAVTDGLCVLHRCDNPECCNPEHLFLGTVADNTRDMDDKGRRVNPGSKLTADQVAEIRDRCAKGESKASLGREYGVNREAIRKVAKGETWRSA